MDLKLANIFCECVSNTTLLKLAYPPNNPAMCCYCKQNNPPCVMDVGSEGRRLFSLPKTFDGCLLSLSCLFPVNIITLRDKNSFWQILLKTPYYKQSLLGSEGPVSKFFLPFFTRDRIYVLCHIWSQNRSQIFVSGTGCAWSGVRKCSESGFFSLSKRALLVPETKIWDLFWYQVCDVVTW